MSEISKTARDAAKRYAGISMESLAHEIQNAIDSAVADERERCALLIEEGIYIGLADKLRELPKE